MNVTSRKPLYALVGLLVVFITAVWLVLGYARSLVQERYSDQIAYVRNVVRAERGALSDAGRREAVRGNFASEDVIELDGMCELIVWYEGGSPHGGYRIGRRLGGTWWVFPSLSHSAVDEPVASLVFSDDGVYVMYAESMQVSGGGTGTFRFAVPLSKLRESR